MPRPQDACHLVHTPDGGSRRRHTSGTGQRSSTHALAVSAKPEVSGSRDATWRAPAVDDAGNVPGDGRKTRPSGYSRCGPRGSTQDAVEACSSAGWVECRRDGRVGGCGWKGAWWKTRVTAATAQCSSYAPPSVACHNDPTSREPLQRKLQHIYSTSLVVTILSVCKSVDDLQITHEITQLQKY